jgi:hypothetical protein
VSTQDATSPSLLVATPTTTATLASFREYAGRVQQTTCADVPAIPACLRVHGFAELCSYVRDMRPSTTSCSPPKSPKIHRNTSHSSSRPKNKPRQKPAALANYFHHSFMLSLFFDNEDGGFIYHRNLGWL